MATNKREDAAAKKAKRQKIILGVIGAVLVGLVALQGPKLLNRGGGTEAASTTPAAPSAAPIATSPAATGGAAAAAAISAPRGKTAAVVAGVPISAGPPSQATHAQLVSFTLFDPKDPFVQAVNSEDATGQPSDSSGTTGASGPSGSDQSQGTGSSGGSSSSSGSGASSASTPAQPIAYATINLNGHPQQVKVKDDFPASSPLFVLKSLQKKAAKIGVAGGSFDDGQAVVLKLNKTVTLLNTATGVRYQLKLVYTGTQPEVIEGFTTGKQGDTTSSTSDQSSAATTAPATTTTTPSG